MPNYWPIGGGGGGSQTPWTQTVDAAGFQLKNCPELINNATTGGATGITLQTTGQIDANSSGAFVVETGQGMGVGVDPTGTPYMFDVSGEVNATGPYFLNGVQTGQWTAGTSGAIYYNGGSVGAGTATPTCSLDVAGFIRASGSTPPTSGVGTEISYTASSSTGFITVYDRTGNAWKALHLVGSSIDITAQNNGPVVFQSFGTGLVGIGMVPTYLLQLSSDSAAKPTTNTWTIASDIRTKRNVEIFKGDIEVIRKLEPIVSEYNGLGGTPEGERVVSFDAAKLRKLVPPCVSSVRGKLRKDDAEETDLLGVNTHELFFHLIRAVQDIDRRLQAAERGNGSKRK